MVSSIDAERQTANAVRLILPARWLERFSAPLSSLANLQLARKKRNVGRGGGDRTHDLRLKRPLLYH